MSQKPAARRPPTSGTGGPSNFSSARPSTSQGAASAKKFAKDKEDAATTTTASGSSGEKGKGKAKGAKVEEREEEEVGGGAGEEMWSEEEDEEAISMLEGIRQASETFHAKRAKKAAQQHEEFKKTIDQALAGVKKDIEKGWEEDEAKINQAMARLTPLLAPEDTAKAKADYARAASARTIVWNKLGHLYDGPVDEAILATRDEDAAHIAEIEGRPNEIKRARKKAIQLAQKEIALVHEEQTMITNGHDLIRNWSSVLKPHPAHFARSPSLTNRKGRSAGVGGGGYYVGGVGGGTSALKRFQQKKMRGMGKGF
ncbi:hypothetical protein BDY24DRAFT_440298 [Mrakia frigida]|uniref:uncharacterized protein n=1 Tax=Mrakia frigida TaxID=29902 RepID=UPI003FCBFF5F